MIDSLPNYDSWKLAGPPEYDGYELEDCPNKFDGDCHSEDCDSCHCPEAPACRCDYAHGACPGVSRCEQREWCDCEPEADEQCRCPDGKCYC